MNVLFLEAAQNLGGARKSTIELAFRLKSNGFNVIFVDFYGTNKDFINQLDKFELNLVVLKQRKDPFIIGNKNKIIHLTNILRFYFERFSLRRKFNDVVKDFKPNYIFVNGTKTLSILDKSSKYKIVFFARGWFIASQINWIEKYILNKKIDIYFAVSQSTRQALFGSGISKFDNIYVVKNGIDISSLQTLDKSKKDLKKSKLILLHSGGFLPSKGHHVSIEISKKLKDLGIDHFLYLTGIIYKEQVSREYYKSIVDQINRYELNNYIEIVVNKNNVQTYFEQADIFIHPSDTEGLPRVIMEAFANKCAVIANPVGGVTDYILDGFTGYIADFNDQNSYVNKIIHLINNIDEKKDVIERAYSLIKKSYSPEVQIKEVSRILNKELTK